MHTAAYDSHVITDDGETILCALDENGNPTDKFYSREYVHQNSIWHGEVALWIINPKTKQVLLQRRSPNKKHLPNKIGLCAGHIDGAETPEDALKHEAMEEIGLDVSKYDVKLLVVLKRNEPRNKRFQYQYCIVAEIPIKKFKIDTAEVAEVLYMDYETLKTKIRNNEPEFTFSWNSEYEKLFSELDKIIDNR